MKLKKLKKVLARYIEIRDTGYKCPKEYPCDIECPLCIGKYHCVNYSYCGANERMFRKADTDALIVRLYAKISKKSADWPSSFEKAKKESLFWGLEADNHRFIVCMHGPGGGLAFNSDKTWADKEGMGKYWSKTDDFFTAEKDYRFIKFKSEKKLYQWFADGAK
jgi:hypothetical protein